MEVWLVCKGRDARVETPITFTEGTHLNPVFLIGSNGI
jgi:hypothetical protein